MKKIKIWMRLGVSIKLTPKELDIVRKGGKEGEKIICKKVKRKKFELDGESYIPADYDIFKEDVDFNI